MNLKTVSNTTHPFDISHGLSLLCILALGLVLSLDKISPSITPVAIPFLGLSIMMAVHHAETIALRVGPSIGAIILALSVTVIEVGLIVSLMGNDSVESLYVSFLGLVFSLTAVVGLAKALSPSIEAGVTAMGVPRAIVGIVIALLVLAPETWAAVAAARANQLQTSLNLALGSGAASIALTVPAVSLYAILNEKTLVLGLDGKGTVFLLISFLTCALTFAGGRTTALMGLVHLTLMFSYIALNLIP